MQIQDIKPHLFSKFSENIKISIGDGKKIIFWTDQWVDGKSLSILFPNLFRTIVNKGETLAEVFQRKEEQFSWNFHFIRNLFSREVEDLEGMIALLEGLHIVSQSKPDNLIWNACNSKSYSVSSMYNLSLVPTSHVDLRERKTFQWIWKNVAPYRVQCFVWMVKLGKLKTGEFLLRIGVLHQNHALCKFCGEVIETLDHSLLLCPIVWNLWVEILVWWGIEWVTPCSMDNLLLVRLKTQT